MRRERVFLRVGSAVPCGRKLHRVRRGIDSFSGAGGETGLPYSRTQLLPDASYSAAAGERARLLAADAALLDFVEQGLVADSELLGGTPPVPVNLAQRVVDDGALRLDGG